MLWLSLFLVMALPWVISFLILAAGDSFTNQGMIVFGFGELSFTVKVFVWFIIGIANHFLVGVCWARPGLTRQFRTRVLQRFERSPDTTGRWSPSRLFRIR